MSEYNDQESTENKPSVPENRIQIIEDYLNTLDRYCRWAEKAGLIVETATTASQAVDRIGERDFDLILTDGLFGRWSLVYKAAREKNIRTVLASGSNEEIEKAEQG